MRESILCVFLFLQIGGRRHMELKNTQKGDEGLGMRESVDLDTMYLWEKARMVEVIGGVEDDRGDEDGVDGEVLHAEPVQLRHEPAYRRAGGGNIFNTLIVKGWEHFRGFPEVQRTQGYWAFTLNYLFDWIEFVYI